MKLRSVLFLVFIVGLLSSCGVDDLEDRVSKIENVLGTNEPLAIDFKTKNLDNIDIEKKTTFLFRSNGHNEYIRDNGDGTFDVFIKRFVDVSGTVGASISFRYKAATKEISNISASAYFYDKFGHTLSPYFSVDNYSMGNTISLVINSINLETGAVSVSVDAITDGTAYNNLYFEKPMSCQFSFSGTLVIFVNN